MTPADAEAAQLRVELLSSRELLPACEALVAQVFKVAPEAVKDWFAKRLLGNPWQADIRGLGVVALDGDRLIGFRGMFGQRWWLEGSERTMAWTANTCMPEGYRGKGLGTALIRKSGECAALCATSSSGLGTQPIYQKLGYQAIGQDNDHYRFRVSFSPSISKRAGSFAGFALGSLLHAVTAPAVPASHGWRLELLGAATDEFDRLWLATREGYGAARVRSQAELNDRLLTAATQPLKLAVIRDPGGLLRGFAIWHVQQHDQHIRWAVLRDLYTAVDDAPARRALLHGLARLWRSQGLAEASLEVAHPALTREFQELGFLHQPSRGVRYQVQAKPELRPETCSNWLRSALDGDYSDLASPDIQ
jgi:GNAT superfamily N-acetyltransferase